jgi:hypothetical protein
MHRRGFCRQIGAVDIPCDEDLNRFQASSAYATSVSDICGVACRSEGECDEIMGTRRKEPTIALWSKIKPHYRAAKCFTEIRQTLVRGDEVS